MTLTDEQVPEILDRLVAVMSDPAEVGLVVQRLTGAQREALALVATRGHIRAHVLARKYGSLRRLGSGRLEWEQAWHRPASVVERLWFLGLLHRGYGLDESYHGEVFFVPQEIRAALPRLDIVLPQFKLVQASPPATSRDDADALSYDAFVLLCYLRRGAVRGKKGVLAQYHFMQIRPRLRLQDPQRLRFLHVVCEAAGLIGYQEGRWMPAQQAAIWLKAGTAARCAQLVQAWSENLQWNELRVLPSLRCEDTGWRNDPRMARKAVLMHLAECPVDTWATVASFQDSIRELEPDFMRPDGDYESWYIRDARSGQYLAGYQNWPRVEGALIRYLLDHPLLWLGVVATGLAVDEEQGACFKLTRLGAAMLGLGQIEEPPSRPFRVKPNMELAVPSGASWYDRFLLERFAHWVEERDGEARYLLDAASLQACLASGVSLRQVQVFLQRVTGRRVPPRVLATLRLWAEAPERGEPHPAAT